MIVGLWIIICYMLQVLHTSLNHSNPIVKSAGIELIAISAKQFSVESLSHALPTWNVAIVKVIRHECAKEGLYMVSCETWIFKMPLLHGESGRMRDGRGCTGYNYGYT